MIIMIPEPALSEFKGLVSIVLTVVCFSTYYFTAQSDRIKAWFVRPKTGTEYLISTFLYRKITGFVFLGVIPAIVTLFIFRVSIVELGFQWGKLSVYYPWILVLIPVIFLLNFLITRKQAIYSKYPELKVKNWNTKILLTSISGWIIYLPAYEFLFRGVLLHGCIETYGPAIAIAVNLFMYAAAHLMQGWRESAGSLIFGLVLCLITLATKSLIPAIILHLSLSVSAEIFAIYHNPEMKFGKQLINPNKDFQT